MTVKRQKHKGERTYNLENLSGHPNTILQNGEATRTHRIRATPDVQNWFASLTTIERGAILARLMEQTRKN